MLKYFLDFLSPLRPLQLSPADSFSVHESQRENTIKVSASQETCAWSLNAPEGAVTETELSVHLSLQRENSCICSSIRMK